MVFVTVGLASEYEFPRLINEMDRVAGELAEEVVMQIGSNSLEPKNARFFRFIPREDMEKLYREARVIVCHGGVGTIVTALGLGKPIIVVPKMKKYSEHMDDQQVELAQELSKEIEMKVVYDVAELGVLLKSPSLAPAKVTKNLNLVAALKSYVDSLAEARVKSRTKPAKVR